MAEEFTRAQENKSSGGTGWFYSSGFAIFLVAYLLSPPLVVKVLVSVGAENNASVRAVLQMVYAPLVYLYEHFKAYRDLLDWLMDLAGVR